MAVVAAAWVTPTTLGTLTFAEPVETMRFTAEPGATLVPLAGFWLMTLPAGTALDGAEVTAPSTRPAPVMAVVAAAWVTPTTLGTMPLAAPVETTRLTAEPRFTMVPPPGF